jgi:pimeloyl-ACP methyl ester carboxylesterase
MTESEAAERVNQYCTPGPRDMGAKARRGLETAQPITFLHTQILEIPAQPRPPVRVTAHVWGESHAPAALLAHGWGLQAGRMMALVQPLRDLGYRVAALDMPAHGSSEGEQGTLIDACATLSDAIAALGGVKLVVGHSFGAMATLQQAAQAHLPGVERIVAIAAARDMGHLFESADFVKTAPEEDRQNMRNAFKRRFGRAPAEFSIAQHASAITLPTLLVYDDRDQVTPLAHGQEFAANIPGAELFVTHGYGHFAILRSPEATAKIAQFAAKV